MNSRFLTVPEAAEKLGMTARAVWQRLYRGQIPHRRWGRKVLISAQELERFLDRLPGKTAEEAAAAVEEAGGWR